ncbi:hypothetical protein RB653_000467 [Dictyostelium firmibasis]|uniref:Transmembrane protein n=1 Tax=Dictyostelium firmibasis TaxID=79012 RepID=A0AAN7U2X5_9MYCE
MSSFVDTCFKLSEGHDFVVFSIHSIVWGTLLHLLNRSDPIKLQQKQQQQQQQQINNKKTNTISPIYKLKPFEFLFLGIMVTVTFINIVLRFIKGVPIWLLQPCHVLSGLLIYIISNKKSDSNIFYLYFYNLWMPLVGILAVPDDSWFYYSWEPFIFYLHHWAMLIVPFYYMFFNHRFHAHFKSSTSLPMEYNGNIRLSTLKNRLRLFVQVFTIGMLYHSLVLGYGGILLNEDLNSMKCRFAGGEIFGIHWREALTIGGWILGWLVAVLPDTLIHCLYYSNKKPSSSTTATKKNTILSILGDGFNFIQSRINLEIKKNN